ncbi:hypothetical protein BJY21_001880 [Kineosphaera limosa]|uniref:Extensin-like C-terminal domain-containing protein n=1 Tax=Kineosphaera limosa NBRC 100340 TaxID=1184609 RepID=K6WSJ8_9MICO|nr:extensin family protein [Kineosphaera limosa]NYE00696.1 hypothetical protein [Kineosphaera limosa]GAB96786.1 hypothetical protein KILIM_049_00030 [Kineosphaera limosa NBRC 100340]
MTQEKRPGRRAVLGAAGLGMLAGAAWWVGPERIGDALGDFVEGAQGVFDEARDGLSEGPGPPGPRPSPTAVTAAQLTDYTRLAGSPLRYEVTDGPARFPMEPGFARQLDASLRSHWQARRWGVPGQLSSLGTHRTAPGGEATSWHHAGRAFDLAAVRTTGGDTLVSCRYDRWGDGPDHEAQAREYWRLAATLHRDFAYVLTYLFDEAHHDHIHLDNALSGQGRSMFRTGSRVQVHAVQAMCTYVWRMPVEASGRWDGATRDATAQILDRVGVGGRLTRSQDSWHAFLTATARQS